MSEPSLDGGLFDNGIGDVGIFPRSDLQPQLNIAKAEGLSSEMRFARTLPQSLKFTAKDFSALRDRAEPIDAVGAKGRNLSFEVLAGDSLNTIVLKDRRKIARAAVKN